MKNIIKTILVSLLLIVGFGFFYLYKLHSLAIEGNNIFEYRCLNVNPHLIAYKKTFLKFADQINNPDWASGEQMAELMTTYNSQMKKYVTAEDIWLTMDKKFIERWDFRLIEPWYIQKAGYLQWKMYEGYRDDAKSLTDLWDHPDQIKALPDPSYVSEQRQRRDKYIEEYYQFFRDASEVADWRKYFGYLPVPKGCTKDNTEIPNTSGSINWGSNGQDATPSSVPIDPYSTS